MNDFLQYILYLFHRGVRFAVPAVLLCVVGLAAAWGIARKQGRSFPWKKAAALLLLIAWLGLTLFVTLFRGEPGYRQWNFHLFLAWKEAWNQFALRVWLNVLLNIALFVPLGILLPLLSRIFRRWYVMLLSGFGISLAIELGQLATGRGMFDVDDLFTNTLGAMVGWGLIMLIRTLMERKPSWKTHCLAYLSIPAALALVLAFALGMFIFLVYKKTFAGVMYSSSFGVTLVALTMITTLVILAVTSNVVLSLGMVGALSIVRFRTAIKEPLDIAFLFWSIAAGIVLAAGLIPLAVFGSVFIGGFLLIFANKKSHLNPYIVVLRCDGHESEAAATEFLKGQVQRLTIKSKTAQKGSIELNVEVRMKSENTDFINTLADMQGVTSAVLVSYNGDYMG